MDINVRMQIHDINASVLQRGLEVGGRVQKFIDSEVLRTTEPYVPFDFGKLKQSGITGTVIGSGKVVYNSVYAKYLYYGKVMVGEQSHSPWARAGERKVVTEKDLTFHSGDSRRGSFWFERSKADHLTQWINGAAQIAGGRS